MAQCKPLFGGPFAAEKVRMLFQDRGVKFDHEQVLQSIDLGERIATNRSPTGTAEQPYDFINRVPPMRAPEVERRTLCHKRHLNVFGLREVSGVPEGKAAASVRWQVPAALAHLLGVISGRPSKEIDSGCTSRALISRLGQAMRIEFDHKDNLIMSFPGGIAPLEVPWIGWVMKTMALRPICISMLRGRT